jgi:hypothetical protein
MAAIPKEPLPDDVAVAAHGENRRRNKAFHPNHYALKLPSDLQLDAHRIRGPVSFLNPTSAHFRPIATPEKHAELSSDPNASLTKLAPTVSYKWTSRNNRKGRHAIVAHADASRTGTGHTIPPPTSSLKSIACGIWRMFTNYPVWDISYDVATIFTIGSVVWVINAFFVWMPLVRPDTEFKNEELYGGGITAFIGATIFVIGSVLLMAEAVNENRTACFGWAVERALSSTEEERADIARLRPAKSACTHHHANKRNLVGKGRITADKDVKVQEGFSKSWTWFPSMTELRTHYIHELGFLASLIQLLAASIFWIAGLTALPGIYNHMSRPITIVFYWTPQVIGGFGFILSGFLFMLETQSKWYKPAFGTLGWWIGLWNLIGGVGFTLCPAFGYDERSWAQYQACVSTFWGSWAFLIGSVVQWYESLQKYPVEVDKSIKKDGRG